MKAKTPTPTPRKTPAAPPRIKKVHPAEQAGMVIHQRVEAGAVTVKHGVVTAATYVGKFFKGLYKGH